MENETAQENRDGLRSIRVITRNIPMMDLASALTNAGWVVEVSGGLMLVLLKVTEPRPSESPEQRHGRIFS